MIVERLKQLIGIVLLGSLAIFLVVHLIQDPTGAAHVVGAIIGGVGKFFSAIWTFLSTLWSKVNK